jgi:hypothetical protein
LLCSETRQRGVRVGGPVERGERLPRPLIGAVGIGDPEHVPTKATHSIPRLERYRMDGHKYPRRKFDPRSMKR